MRTQQRTRLERLEKQAPGEEPPARGLTMAEVLAREDGVAFLLKVADRLCAEQEEDQTDTLDRDRPQTRPGSLP